MSVAALPADEPPRACQACSDRAALLASLSGRIECSGRDRQGLEVLLALPARELLRALGVSTDRSPPAVAERRPRSTEPALCPHHHDYPRRLRELGAPPAVLHLGGDPARVCELLRLPAVAIVGARSCSPYGTHAARTLAASLSAAGACVISGMAMGIDAAAHEGALEGGGATLAVLAGGVDVPYPANKRSLHARLRARAGLLGELPAGTRPRRWCFVARNRLIAALARVTVVVEARARSGALITASYAGDLGRDVAALPGPVTSSRSDGTNALIRDGAHLVRDAQDVLDLVYGAGVRRAAAPDGELGPGLRALLARVRSGEDTPGALASNGVALDDALAGLCELELRGWVRRSLGGRYLPVTR